MTLKKSLNNKKKAIKEANNFSFVLSMCIIISKLTYSLEEFFWYWKRKKTKDIMGLLFHSLEELEDNINQAGQDKFSIFCYLGNHEITFLFYIQSIKRHICVRNFIIPN